LSDGIFWGLCGPSLGWRAQIAYIKIMARYLITSALPYINGIKHLGNLAGSMLPSDVHARFRRLQGHEVLFVCATDEHGTPAELAAAEAGMSTKAYCDEQHDIQRRAGDGYSLSFDWFGRSSSAQNFASMMPASCPTGMWRGRARSVAMRMRAATSATIAGLF
jgi:hypothetical protein